MRKAISLLELAIGGVFTVAVVAYITEGVLLAAQVAL